MGLPLVVTLVFVVAALAFEVETSEEINSPGGLLGVARMSSVNLISLSSLTLPEYNNNDHHDHSIIQQYYFCKRGLKYFAYVTLRFSFFSLCEKNVFISDQLESRNPNRLKMTCAESMNELAGHFQVK